MCQALCDKNMHLNIVASGICFVASWLPTAVSCPRSRPDANSLSVTLQLGQLILQLLDKFTVHFVVFCVFIVLGDSGVVAHGTLTATLPVLDCQYLGAASAAQKSLVRKASASDEKHSQQLQRLGHASVVRIITMPLHAVAGYP